MAESIRGLTIEISADASGFNKSMNAIRKDAKSSQKELDALQKSLELEYDPSKFERAQRVAQEAIDTTAQQADILRKRLQFLEESGKADTSDYRRISAELAQTELNGQKLEGQLAKINGIKFDHAGKAVQSLKGELDTLQKSLELKFDSDKFVRAQNVAKEAIKKVTDQAEELRDQLRGLEKIGETDTEPYRKLQDELQKCDKESEDFKTSIERLNATKLDQLKKSISGIGEGLESAGKKLTPLSVGAAGALTGLGALGTRAVSTADEIATLATQYDMTSDALGRFNYVALQTDTDAETLYKSFVKMRAGIADIATGTTTQASTALQQLGIDLNSFGSSEEQFYAIITALADMGDRTQMVAIANDLFGEKLANNLLPLIYSGSDAIRTYADEYENLGALSGEQVDALAEFDNVLNTLKTQFSNVALQIGSALLPVMQTIADFVKNEVLPKLQALAEWFSSLSIEQQEFALKALAVLAALGPVTVGIGKMTSAVGGIVGMLPKLQSGLSQLAHHPIILIIAAVVAVLALLYTRCDSFRESVNALVGAIGSALAPVLSAVMGLLSSLFELLMPILDILGEILGTVIGLVTEALFPILESLSLLFGLIGPLIEVALIPLQLALSAISIPLNLLGTLLGWLSPLFVVFGEVVNSVFNGIIYIVNFVLGFIEGAINGCIGLINGLIDGINAALGWLGVSIGHIDEVKLRIDTAEIENMDDVEAQIKPATSDSGEVSLPTSGTVYDLLGAGSSSGDVYNNDYSTTNTTQNVTVVIENYAAEVDVDALVSEINIKLAEAM